MERRRLILLSVYMACALLSLGLIYLNCILYSEEVVSLVGLILRIVTIFGCWIAVVVRANSSAENAVESGAKLASILLGTVVLIFHIVPFAHMAVAAKHGDSEESYTITE